MSFSKQEFASCLKQLNLQQIEAAKLLSVTPRTINRWAENPDEITGPAEQALRAWLRLHNYNLPWRPDSFPIAEDNLEFPEQISQFRNAAIALDQILQKVQARGGSTLPWHIDLKKGIARLETIEVSFYKTHEGCFSPAMYRRTDQQFPDMVKDQPLLEDAIFSIHQALSKENSKMKERL